MEHFHRYEVASAYCFSLSEIWGLLAVEAKRRNLPLPTSEQVFLQACGGNYDGDPTSIDLVFKVPFTPEEVKAQEVENAQAKVDRDARHEKAEIAKYHELRSKYG